VALAASMESTSCASLPANYFSDLLATFRRKSHVSDSADKGISSLALEIYPRGSFLRDLPRGKIKGVPATERERPCRAICPKKRSPNDLSGTLESHRSPPEGRQVETFPLSPLPCVAALYRQRATTPGPVKEGGRAPSSWENSNQATAGTRVGQKTLVHSLFLAGPPCARRGLIDTGGLRDGRRGEGGEERPSRGRVGPGECKLSSGRSRANAAEILSEKERVSGNRNQRGADALFLSPAPKCGRCVRPPGGEGERGVVIQGRRRPSGREREAIVLNDEENGGLFRKCASLQRSIKERGLPNLDQIMHELQNDSFSSRHD